ncbi:hypothetical protein [Methanobacterium aggregans]|uniref:hypothetical protein n=1 Tax=Methanobacterium aggregans TaxID=1615586 RepID=UPI001AE477F1|nr:hypothetical protein [Methanobacterium aggregans]MBP2045988.1 hypothetical protein [Methanobacterium aggregans]
MESNIFTQRRHKPLNTRFPQIIHMRINSLSVIIREKPIIIMLDLDFKKLLQLFHGQS